MFLKLCKFCFRCLFYSAFTFVALILLNYQWIDWSKTDSSFDELELLPHNTAGLVLGTSPHISGGRPNEFFHARMDAAAQLYQAGKVDKLLVSGSNDGQYYDEGRLMTQALVDRGVPREIIFSDNAGYRTLDSMLRARDVFGLSHFTIISQPFHNHRALYIAHHHGIEAIAYNAHNPSGWENIRAKFREHGARVLMMLDLYLLKTQPRENTAPKKAFLAE